MRFLAVVALLVGLASIARADTSILGSAPLVVGVSDDAKRVIGVRPEVVLVFHRRSVIATLSEGVSVGVGAYAEVSWIDGERGGGGGGTLVMYRPPYAIALSGGVYDERATGGVFAGFRLPQRFGAESFGGLDVTFGVRVDVRRDAGGAAAMTATVQVDLIPLAMMLGLIAMMR